MESPLWSWIVSFLPDSGKTSQRFRFDDRTIPMVVLWAVLHDRPMNWACQAGNGKPHLRPDRLPSPSTISRRCRHPRMRELLNEVHRIAREHGRSFYTPIRQNRAGRRFGPMTNFACGFRGLPNWARRKHRVTRWIWGKILIYHTYLMELKKTRGQKE